MLVGETTDAIISSAPIFRVNARTVVLESKCIDSGVRIKLFTSHPALMFYFIRFGAVGSRHHFVGSLNVSAYTFDDSTRAFANIRLSVTDAKPIIQVDDDGEIIPTLAKRVRTKEFQRTHQFLKMKFVVYKHVWENIQDQNVVINRGLNSEAFALQLSDMYEDLVSKGLIVENYNPVFVEERISRPQSDPNTNRPVLGYNNSCKRLEDSWDDRSFGYDTLLNDTTAFRDSDIISDEREDISSES
ncbi:uncharacterized protein EV154DRAFT_540880 [Mucor mucedo]|uniref:uncharacterized protein n=1 Tax=Mucor mucedo TaxID=29922 RepID=UPI0022203A4F|nr:uncharacterized protein EV154DRAFT_540880 [Mucor mucedo]KAI7868387.1 hypothetical protein EV154DRAFT_540880 [Mucor mucedo]